MPASDCIRRILATCRTIAVVGLSPKPHRASFGVARIMQAHGYRIIPINPNASEILGEKAYPSLLEAARHEHIDLVNCFRNSADIPPIVDDAIAIGAKAVWMQLGIENEAAAEKAEAAGLLVVQDKCLKVEYARLSATMGGMNTPAHTSAFAPLQNDTFIRACLRQATDYTPVWLMRQAGRFLPEYRATRAKAGSFMGLATNTDYATEVTLQPVDRFPLDAAILFSDILTVPDAMGLGLSFALGEGPKFAHPVRDEAAVAKLAVPDMDKLRYVFDAVTSIRKALNGRVPLIGFSGSPWTLACYMVEGAGSDDYRLVKTMLYSRPDLMHKILQINADAVAQYLNAQIDAGAQAVMIFDSWGGVLADGAFQQFSLAYTARVLAQLKKEHAGVRIPRIVFTKGGGLWLDEMGQLDCDVLGLDWTVNLAKARALVGNTKALQGNLDPNALFASPAQIQAEVARVLDSFGSPHTAPKNQPEATGPTHIFNLGHGISQHTPPDHVAVLVQAVHDYSRKMRA